MPLTPCARDPPVMHRASESRRFLGQSRPRRASTRAEGTAVSSVPGSGSDRFLVVAALLCGFACDLTSGHWRGEDGRY